MRKRAAEAALICVITVIAKGQCCIGVERICASPCQSVMRPMLFSKSVPILDCAIDIDGTCSGTDSLKLVLCNPLRMIEGFTHIPTGSNCGSGNLLNWTLNRDRLFINKLPDEYSARVSNPVSRSVARVFDNNINTKLSEIGFNDHGFSFASLPLSPSIKHIELRHADKGTILLLRGGVLLPTNSNQQICEDREQQRENNKQRVSYLETVVKHSPEFVRLGSLLSSILGRISGLAFIWLGLSRSNKLIAICLQAIGLALMAYAPIGLLLGNDLYSLFF